MAQSRLSEELKEELRAEFERSGFHRVGFTDSSVLAKEREYLEKRGPGPFEPTELPPRTDPALLLPDARSVIVVAMSYHHADPPRPPHPTGRLSKYCRGLDYHDVMLARLERMGELIRSRHGCRSLCYVDMGPPLERAFAEKAGLGRLGKNTNLIAPKLGSWIFLGMMVTELSIPPDSPATYSICGNCRLCIEACPTGCISEWEIDSRNCVGYLNQEHGEIPVEHRESMGDWLFGCDICQDVCPHNIRAASDLSPEFQPLPLPGAFPDLRRMVEMTDDDFEKWFKPTAADWRGREAVKRNALLALGNSEISEAVDILIESELEGDPILREQAVWSAGRLAERFPDRRSDLDHFIRKNT